MQIRRDILQGKLQLPPSTACLIASYTVQCKLRDTMINLKQLHCLYLGSLQQELKFLIIKTICDSFFFSFFSAELGDYHPEEHGPGYLSRLQLIPGQTEEMERKICELHKLHK